MGQHDDSDNDDDSCGSIISSCGGDGYDPDDNGVV
uniref:Uncharacterized protein n=1 Tax=Setaria digitata TaxID=48799 RepID=A0A915PN40_9BILA